MLKPRLAGYLLRETAGLYALGLGAFCLLLFIDFLSVWAEFFIKQDAGFAVIGKFLLFKLPWALHLSLPIAGVFAVLLATGRLAKDSELKAAYASGVPPLSLLIPLLGFGLMVSLAAFYNNGFLEPQSEISYNNIYYGIYNERPPAERQSDVSYFIDGQGIYYAGRIQADLDNADKAFLRGVLILKDDGSLLSAQNGDWDSNVKKWQLSDVSVLLPGETPALEAALALPFETSNDTEVSLAKSETLTLSELQTRIKIERQGGADTKKSIFEFHRRIADAFSAFIFVLIAAVLGLHLRNRSAGFGWTIVLLVFFYFLWVLSGSLFDQQVLAPIPAAWFTTTLVGFVGIVLAAVRLR